MATIRSPVDVITRADSDCVVFGWSKVVQGWDGSPSGWDETWWRSPNWPRNTERGGVTLDRHNGQSNCLFFDGHVKSRKPSQVTLQKVDPSG